MPPCVCRVVPAVHGGGVSVRRHVRPPPVLWETHLFDEVSPGELRDLQTGEDQAPRDELRRRAEPHRLSVPPSGGGEGVPLWKTQEADAVP